MPFYKEKTLPDGSVGNYWAVYDMTFKRRPSGMRVDLVLALYKDSTPGLAPLNFSCQFSFAVTAQELAGNIISVAHTKMLAEISALYTPINGVGDPVSKYPYLVGATIVQ